MVVNFTDAALVDPFKAEMDDDFEQFLPALDAGGFVMDLANLSDADKTFAEGVKWYRYIQFDPPEQIRAIQLELIEKGNAVRDFFRAIQTYVMLFNRMLHGILGVGESGLSIGLVPTFAYRDWPLVSAANSGANRCDITVRWDGGSNDPRDITTTSFTVNPDWSPGDPDETHYNSVPSGFAFPNGGLVTFQPPSILKFHAGLVCYKIICDENMEAGDTFILRCWGTISSLAATDDVNDSQSGEDIMVRYLFYPGHAREEWTRLRKTYPFFAKPVTLTIEGPTATEHELIAKRVWPDASFCACTITKTDASVVNFNPVGLLRIEHTGTTGYRTIVNLTSFNVTDVASMSFTLWAESTEGDARVVGQNRCGHDQEDPSQSWGEVVSGCGHVCGERFTASGIANYRAGNDTTGGCFLYNSCNKFALERVGSNPMAMFGSLLWSHPFAYIQGIEGDVDSFQLFRIGFPSLGSEAQMLLELANGKHPVKFFWLNAGGLCQRRIAGGQVVSDYGLTYLKQPDQPLPLRTDSATWPPGGPAYDLWDEKTPEYPGATDPMNLQKSAVSENGDFMAHPYQIESGFTSFLGRYQRFRPYSVLFYDLPAAGVMSKQYPDGLMERGSWTFDDQTYVMRFKLLPFRFGRGQRGWSSGGHGAEIKKAVIADGKIQFFLKHGLWSASSFFGGEAEVFTTWKGGGTHVALPEFLQPRSHATPCAVGFNRNLMHPGQTGRIAGEDLQALYVIEAEACYMGTGAELDTWKPDDSIPGSEPDYLENQIMIHGIGGFGGFGKLPRDYNLWGNYTDCVVLDDPIGEWAAKGEAWFANKTLNCANDGVISAQTEASITLRESQVDFFTRVEPAEGRLYTTAIDEGNSLALTAEFADRLSLANHRGIVAMRKILANAVS